MGHQLDILSNLLHENLEYKKQQGRNNRKPLYMNMKTDDVMFVVGSFLLFALGGITATVVRTLRKP